MYKIGKPCSTSKSYFITPEERMEINLEKARDLLEEIGWKTKKFSKVLAIFEKEGVSISVFPSGKVIVKELNKEIVEKIAREVFDAIIKARTKRALFPNLCPATPPLPVLLCPQPPSP